MASEERRQIMKKVYTIEWMCSYCGKKVTAPETYGRPAPGCCMRKGNGQPHRWVKNRKY